MNILAKALMILASAGSGKTFQLSNRFIGLIGTGVDPRTVVALTFTRKAAGEFADEILSKLANAAVDPDAASRLHDGAGCAKADFAECLERLVRVLPEVTLGTIDSFFTRIVRGFQHELGITSGSFELIEGPVAAAAEDEILAAILRDGLGAAEGEEFLHAFRRATAGREERRIVDSLREFVKGWHGYWRDGIPLDHWGGTELLGGEEPEPWEDVKRKALAPLRAAIEEQDYTDRRQKAALQKVIDAMERHTTGSGSLGKAPALFRRLVTESATTATGPMILSHYKEFEIDAAAADLFRSVVRGAARAELLIALERTRAVADLVRVYDAACEQRLRRRGRLGFDEVKRLMGEWVRGEEARLRREAVDFRLDARYDHWLLDEFQDTSPAEWTGLLPLLDEAVSGEESTVFVVGDKKQAIYGWRGGDVGLFDEVRKRYGGGLATESMPVSWRSCPEVLALVNRVCGDLGTIEELFGAEAAGKWEWEEHVSAEPLQDPGNRGHARVEVVDGRREVRLARMVEVMREIGVGERELTCGVLVRTNNELRDVADLLRSEGFDVVEEGRRQPAVDNPPGVAIRNLIEWLAQPADHYAQEVVAMSPLAAVLRERYGEAWQAVWEGALRDAEELGLSGMVEALVEPLWSEWSAFGQRRAGDVIGALQQLDAAGGTVREAARVLADFEVAQPPGVAAVQVMTVHKSKGLGFDVVMLPEIPDDRVPNRSYFRRAGGKGWVTEVPAEWAREFVPELQEAEAGWSAVQRYEAFCVLYVALTRAKRGIYVFLSPSPSTRKEAPWASQSEWLARSCGSDRSVGIAFEEGDPGGIKSVLKLGKEPKPTKPAPLGKAVPRRARRTPSGDEMHKPGSGGSAGGRRFGSEVHAAFEKVGWIEDGLDGLGGGAAADLVRECLEVGQIRDCFTRRDGFEAQGEVPVETILGGTWMSGVIDRLHIRRDSDGEVVALEVIDFKTDAVDEAEELLQRYSGQLQSYRDALSGIFGLPEDAIRCMLLWTRDKVLVEVP